MDLDQAGVQKVGDAGAAGVLTKQSGFSISDSEEKGETNNGLFGQFLQSKRS